MFRINSLTSKISFFPKNEDVGMHRVNITVTDGNSFDFWDVVFIVENKNDPPFLEKIGTLIALEGEKEEGRKGL